MTLYAHALSPVLLEQSLFHSIHTQLTYSSHRTPDIGFDFKTGTGKPFSYFSNGAACSEVEIDCLTGDHLVREPVEYTFLFGVSFSLIDRIVF
ncbi:hypothetical protein DPMN_101856 [Dreissena polymorpha]|uniref:Aldehyde oxidase/xanthine dehydrogenase second molybdopterin binding domain-containing protein n=1 Tax=Dreissena polymorpha TaxID=45954 RepID=A0A9D4RAE7_DREPO|nr:hypothetical protein DPMN_101856 [Dreissena polymorpha]